jgi:hypothetical protein
MSINNLTGEHGYSSSLRALFARDDAGPRLARIIEHYQCAVTTKSQNADGATHGVRLLFGESSQLDHEEAAKALLARLDALRAARPLEHVAHLRGKAFELMGEKRVHNQWTQPYGPRTPSPSPASSSQPVPAPSPTAQPVESAPTRQPAAPSGTAGPAPGLTFTATGGVHLSAGDNTLSRVAINSTGLGVEGDNATSVSTLSITDSTIQSSEYALYVGSAQAINLTRVNAVTGANGDNPYGMRVGSAPLVRIVDSVFDNSASVPVANAHGRMAKNSIRLAGVTESGSGIFNSTVRGGQIMLGGGAADGNVGWQSFGNFTISGGAFECTDPMATALQIYGGVGAAGPVVIENWNVTSEGPYFASILGNATNITFRNVTYNGEPLSWEHFHNSAALQQYASQPGVNIRIEP